MTELCVSGSFACHLRVVNLSGCHNISAGGMEDILRHVSVDVTACSNETVLRAVARRGRPDAVIHAPAEGVGGVGADAAGGGGVGCVDATPRARVALDSPLALDLCARLRLLEEGSAIRFRTLAHSPAGECAKVSCRRLLENSLFQGAAHGTGSDVAILLSLVFAFGDDIRT